jgi:S1-C subfamily serine protease
MTTLWTFLFLAAAQTPAPSKPVAPPALPPNTVVKSDVFPDTRQWEAMACTARLKGVTGELGTAVVVGKRDGAAYLLTANHVVTENADRTLEFFTKETYLNQPLVLTISESPVFRAPQADIAIIKVNLGNRTLPVLKLPTPGKKARPNKFPAKALSIGCSNGEKPTCREEDLIAKVLVRKSIDSGIFFWQAKLASIEGRSGGPLIHMGEDGTLSLIGICSANQNNVGYYTHLDEIHVALKEGGYAWIWESIKAP